MNIKLYFSLMIVINSLYWGWSEVYIHEGLFIYGFTAGGIASLFCALIGAIAGLCVFKLKGKS